MNRFGLKLVLSLIVALLGLSALDFCFANFDYPWFPGQAYGALVLGLVVTLLVAAAITKIVYFQPKPKFQKAQKEESE